MQEAEEQRLAMAARRVLEETGKDTEETLEAWQQKANEVVRNMELVWYVFKDRNMNIVHVFNFFVSNLFFLQLQQSLSMHIYIILSLFLVQHCSSVIRRNKNVCKIG